MGSTGGSTGSGSTGSAGSTYGAGTSGSTGSGTGGSTGSSGSTYGAGTSGSSGGTGSTGSSTGGSSGGGYSAGGGTGTDDGEGFLDRARDAISDMADRARDALSDVADAAKDLAGRGSDKMGGPVPAVAAVVGALATTVGGWWAMHAGSDTRVDLGEEDERHFRSHFDTHPPRESGRLTYEDARTGYTLGHAASRNPSYSGRGFDEVEPELRRGFTGEHSGSYDSLRDYTRYGYERGTGRSGTSGTGTGGTGTSGTGTSGTGSV
jgi:hypothetical protein